MFTAPKAKEYFWIRFSTDKQNAHLIQLNVRANVVVAVAELQVTRSLYCYPEKDFRLTKKLKQKTPCVQIFVFSENFLDHIVAKQRK